jgi:phospholipid transport system substrate-binding protein
MTLNKKKAVAARIWGPVFFALWLLPAAAAAGVPTEQIRSTVDKALLVLKDPRLKIAAKTKERRDQLKQILFTRFDFTEMAKRALGANWRRRTLKEQEEFVQLFTEILERSYAEIIESYTNEKIVYIGEKLDGVYADVASKVLTSKGEEYSINYKAHLVNSEWRVYDVIAENISLVNNFRSQFNRVISNGSYDELLRRLKEKAEIGTPKN